MSNSAAANAQADLDGRALRIGLVAARFNGEIVSQMESLCVERLIELGARENNIARHSAPGAYELPYALQTIARRAAERGEPIDALVALGCIVRGETVHFELIAQQVGLNIARVSLERDIPIIFGVLTVDALEQAKARVKQGARYADNAVEMGNFRRRSGPRG